MLIDTLSKLPKEIQRKVKITNNKANTDPSTTKGYERIIIPTELDLDDFYQENKEAIDDNITEGIEYACRPIYAAMQVEPIGLPVIEDVLTTITNGYLKNTVEYDYD